MLKLKNIKKIYKTSFEDVIALNDISLNFRKNEFVSILGPSGCGKTTLLNIIGGLDRYTSGDLIINGKSTEDFTDRDWDSYRNHSIGFVFQNYNLIPHLTVYENVELALTISGVKKEKRSQMVLEALEKVGLDNKAKVKPNQLSGGQMQRVAIARALVNKPEIILADEPTGALDTKTSIQILELLKELASEHLVIMVTHNPELASTYSTRIISLKDGLIISDTNPYDDSLNKTEKKEINNQKVKSKLKKTSMSFFTALSLSLKNLLTKKGRTFLVAFAGSIGIIGIATILAISSGFKNYIKNVEEDTLSTYPLTIYEKETNMSSTLELFMGKSDTNEERDDDKVYSNNVFSNFMSSLLSGTHTNNLTEFNKYLENNEIELNKYVSSIERYYSTDINIFLTKDDNYVQVNPSKVFENAFKKANLSGMAATFTSNLNVWSQMLNNQELLESQYDLVAGYWPKEYNEVVLVLDKNNGIMDVALYALGLKPQDELDNLLNDIKQGKEVNTTSTIYSFDELLNLKFKLLLNTDFYKYNGINGYTYEYDNIDYMNSILSEAVDIKVSGIIKPSEDAVSQSIKGIIAYNSSLVDYCVTKTNESEIVKKQLANPEIDVFTGLPFANDNITLESIRNIINQIPDEDKKLDFLNKIDSALESGYSEEFIISYLSNYLEAIYSYAGIKIESYESNIEKLGVANLDSPETINIYPVNFASKDEIIRIIEEYNESVRKEGKEELVIQYTDYIGILMSSISDVIDAISYVLFAFVAISLVVSSIMIGIITYISVLERIKEIGVLRSVGASKVDITRVFNAETFIIGLTSGILGIAITLLLTIPINLIIASLAGIYNVSKLPTLGAILLIIISVILSLVAGLIPAITAAKKNPVEALRSE